MYSWQVQGQELGQAHEASAVRKGIDDVVRGLSVWDERHDRTLWPRSYIVTCHVGVPVGGGSLWLRGEARVDSTPGSCPLALTMLRVHQVNRRTCRNLRVV